MPSSGYSITTVEPVAADAWTQQQIRGQYRLVIMGAAKVGKTSIVKRFLYDEFNSEHKPTVEDVYREEYNLGNYGLVLDILDTSGSYEFPAMRDLAISTGDAFVLVYSIDDSDTFEEVRTLREKILDRRKSNVPILVVGNKCDLEDGRVVKREVAETVIRMDWENAFLESSAKNNVNVFEVFKELLVQANIPYNLCSSNKKRRTSFPDYAISSGKQKCFVNKIGCNVS
ncbi:ras-related protein Rap-1b-like protein [Centruroides sculpturatus]|uniref:ras-related protein Rap-1b-like protein n=1 Tax=Centruroides sculpturatus TaxID=218467 RepID=UPI000C6DCE09|nr:ras-related protein Rap-1b-like protein [Centruroides sculpturatus]XP_023209612.1 ras-related protein Rap-1b-like protein [Centruroides sculpturatus]XP_023209613.1 ras-related protein Rap-1b-like protein [Centruroides sculpturatus]XP_023209614.1 ras-related protein Rap-1b-like protein [Centruroides sculpturatus]